MTEPDEQSDVTEPDPIADAGRRALAEAQRLFALDVYDPPVGLNNEPATRSRRVIDDILTAAGWTWEVPYRGDGQTEWCGLFAAACWRAAGLDPKWLATYWASTYRLDLWARYEAFDAKHPNPKPTSGPFRLMAELDDHSTSLPFDPQPGDVFMVGNGKPAPGNHITIVESYASGVFHTISGNGVGLGPDGKQRQGIVRRDFKLGGPGYCARRLIRPAPSDLAA